MNNIESNTTFWLELSKYKIQVPYYQRDYAQGRIDEGRVDNIRKVFVEELYKAIQGGKTCHLGLVFGSYNEDDKTFIAVDGQQRLTTVFLLHWYVAWREGKLNEYQNVLKKFSWNTRSFSSQFVNLLFTVSHSTEGVIADIQKHTDYFSIWENDPSVTGMLTMLQEIDKQYNGKGDLYKNLFSNSCNIRYDILKLEKNSDGKTYLKMNSRGRSLTTFELFKSKFVDYFNPVFGKKFDNEWLNFVLRMSEKPKIKGQIDEVLFGDPDVCFMNFINEYTYLQFKLNEKTNETGDSQVFINAKLKENLTDLPYISFEKYIPAFKNKLSYFENTFDWIVDNYKAISIVDSELRFEGSRFYLDSIIKENNPNFSHRVKLFALIKYAELTAYSEIDQLLFQRWTRVFRNLVSNTDIDNSRMNDICMSINNINSADIYLYLVTNKNKLSGFNEDQVKEERAKAQQILFGLPRIDGVSWEKVICGAERYSFFEGAISFLFSDEKGEMKDWDNFDTKWNNAKEYFDDNGVRIKYREKSVLLRSYISSFNDWWMFWNFEYDNEAETWGNLLTSARYFANHQLLMGLINDNFITFSSPLIDNNEGEIELRKRVHEYLVKTSILEEASKWQSRLNWRYETYSLYPYNTRAQWKIYVIGNNRNELLSSLCNSQLIIDSDNQMFCGKFFWGWDVNFKYKDKNFQWYRNDYVYLMDNDNRYAYLLREEKSDEETKKYYCFNVTVNMDEEAFIKNLQKLIRQSNA